nr:alpha-N-acetylglucosaminidase TIM-barrel domain-containing protein [Paenibacillus guangzhouensis]
MKRTLTIMCMLLMLTSMLDPGRLGFNVRAAPAAGAGVFDTQPAIEVLKRLIPKQYDQVHFIAVDRGSKGDYFRIAGTSGSLEISGTSPAVLLTGFNWYLKSIAKANVNWNGEQLNLPMQLPLPGSPIEQQANVSHRYALNDTDDGYTGAYRTWEDWQRLIDVLALHGINEVLVTVGQEAVYYDTFQEFGYTEQEMRDWITLPAHQPWWLLQNMCCFGVRSRSN